MEIFFFWLVMAGIVAMIASSKGKSGGGWFFYGLLIWPIALVHIIVTPADAHAAESLALAAGGKKCPQCAEMIKRDALVCRFCGNRDFQTSLDAIIDEYGRERHGGTGPTTWQKLWWKPEPPHDGRR